MTEKSEVETVELPQDVLSFADDVFGDVVDYVADENDDLGETPLFESITIDVNAGELVEAIDYEVVEFPDDKEIRQP